MDLNTIASRLANGQYGRPMDLASDAGRMFAGFAAGARLNDGVAQWVGCRREAGCREAVAPAAMRVLEACPARVVQPPHLQKTGLLFSHGACLPAPPSAPAVYPEGTQQRLALQQLQSAFETLWQRVLAQYAHL